jgi:hypothetical protein
MIFHSSKTKGINLLGSEWTLIVPLHLEEPAKYYFMNHLEFVKKNINLFHTLGCITKIKGLKIERDMSDSDLPHIGSSCGSDGKGMYLRIHQYTGLTDEQYKIIKNLFPLSIEGFELRLHSIGDFDYDEDRTWAPSVQFGVYKNNLNMLTR